MTLVPPTSRPVARFTARLQIYGAFETVDTFALELELMQGSDLFDRLTESGPVPENHARHIALQVAG